MPRNLCLRAAAMSPPFTKAPPPFHSLISKSVFVGARLARWSIAFLIALGGTGPAKADDLEVRGNPARGGTVNVTYRFSQPANGTGFLNIEWRDAVGRVVERRHLPLMLSQAGDVVFPLDLRRAVTSWNELTARLSLNGNKDERPIEHDERMTFAVPVSGDPWSDYQIIVWQGQSPKAYETLKRVGVTGAMVEMDRSTGQFQSADLQRALQNDLSFYLENIATDFYAPYHRYYEGRAPNWQFRDLKERYRVNPADSSVFLRDPSLSDPSWLAKIRDRLMANARALHPYRPLFYNLGDEPGIADLSAFWDFDLSVPSLVGMQDWLKKSYGSLASLNAEWGTEFADWNHVQPMLTDEALRRTNDNFAAWADFKAWMDEAFAGALASGSAAIHEADPRALSAIEGGQIPGWGGYDYSRLAHAVDLMELYDYGENIEIARSLNPKLVLLTTASQSGTGEMRRVWRELLRGTRGLVLWDDNKSFVGDDGDLGKRGREAAPYFRAIRDGIGALLINSERQLDPIAILYSPASMRTQWIIDRKVSGEDWARRTASIEYEDDAIRISTRNYVHLIEHMGLQQHFVTADDIEHGSLERAGDRVLILPHAIALSLAAADAIRQFITEGGTVIADGTPGLFDEHSRRLPRPLLSDVFTTLSTGAMTSFAFGKGTAAYLSAQNPSAAVGPLARLFGAAGVTPRIPITHPNGDAVGDVETYVFSQGATTIIGLLRDLPPTGFLSVFGAPSEEEIVLKLPQPAFIYNVRSGTLVARSDILRIKLGLFEPTLLTLSSVPLAPPAIKGPQRIALGETADFDFTTGGESSILHVEVFDPKGKSIRSYSGNLIATNGRGSKSLPIALNDPEGNWQIRATDLRSGVSATFDVEVVH